MESSVKPVAQSTVSSLDRDSSTLERYMDGEMNPGRSLDFFKTVARWSQSEFARISWVIALADIDVDLQHF